MKRRDLTIYVAAVGGTVATLLLGWLLGWVDFFRPVYLWTLCGLPLFWLLSTRSLAGLHGTTNRNALILRSLLFTLLAVALADIQIVKKSDTLGVFFLMDYSASIPETARETQLKYVNAAAETKNPKDLAGIIVFAEQPSIEYAPGNELKISALHSDVNPDYTNVQSAVELAAAAFPPGVRKKIVLISDGNQNSGDVMAALRQTGSDQVEVDVLPVFFQAPTEVMADKLHLPERIRENEAFDLNFYVTASQRGPATITIFRNEVPVAQRRVILQPGSANQFTMSMRLEAPGFYVYTGRVTSENDTIRANNEASSYVYIQGKARVLIVAPEGGNQDVEHLVDICKEESLEPTLITPMTFPVRIDELNRYDLVILANVPASDFTKDQMKMTQAAVRDLGLGLIMVGGVNSFGAGDYQGTPIEKALPVDMSIKQRKIMPKGALAIILHTCEFAKGNYWAKEVTKAAIDTVQPRDEVGVIYYDSMGGVKWLFSLREASNKAYMKNKISKCEPGDMPSFVPAFEAARKELMKTDAMVRHVICISDGDPAKPSTKDVAIMAQNKITVSCVAIKPHSPRDVDVMKYISLKTRGRFYNLKEEDAGQLPQIFIKEAQVVKRSLIYNKPFQPQLYLTSELTKGIRQENVPPLLAYVATTPKKRALVSIRSEGENKDPILAQWRHGLGKAVAFTSDASSNWAKNWVGWDKFRKLWSQTIRWTARMRRKANLHVSHRIDGNKVVMTVDALDADGNFVNFTNLEGRRVDRDNAGHRLAFHQVGPGRYQAEFDSRKGGVNLVNVFYSEPDGGQGFVQTGVALPYSPEYKQLKTNVTLLKRIAEAGGGKGEFLDNDPTLAEIFTSKLPPSVLPQSIWEYLLVIALILFMTDVFIRRVILTREDLAHAWGALVGKMQLKEEREQDETMSALLKRKEDSALKHSVDDSFRMRLQDNADEVDSTPLELDSEDVTEDSSTTGTPATPETPQSTEKKVDPESYTNRLLDAKRRARDRDKE